MQVAGTVADGFEPVRDAFAANFAERGELGAACCVYVGATPVVDLWGGVVPPGSDEPYGPRTLELVASATKGALAICVHRLVQQGRLDLDAPVPEYWPEFAAAGKRALPVRYLLDHRAGLPVTDARLDLAGTLDWPTVAGALAETAPVWEPGSAHGYHAFTYGWLVGEVVARVTGQSPWQFFAAEVARPLGLDLHIGLPAAEHGRVSPVLPPPPPADGPAAELAGRMADPDSLTHRAYFLDTGLFAALFDDRRTWAVELPAANGMATAHALARMYAACLTEVDGIRLLSPQTLATATALQASGADLVTGYETSYALGFQLPFPVPADGRRGVVRALRTGRLRRLRERPARRRVRLHGQPDGAGRPGRCAVGSARRRATGLLAGRAGWLGATARRGRAWTEERVAAGPSDEGRRGPQSRAGAQGG